jgi:hypothetical protein
MITDELLDELVEEASAEEVDSVLELIAKETVQECNLVPVSNSAQLEKRGWHVWLKTLFPFAFDEEFSDDHRKFWDLYFSVLLRIREQRKLIQVGLPVPEHLVIADKEYVTLLILGRGLAKSSTIEASSVMRGAILNSGYCLFVCEAQDQADEHIGNCKGLIEHSDSKLKDYYPSMAVVEGATVEGIKTKDRNDLFITQNGWICRAKGLNSKLRGLRIGNRRPDDIDIDDIDGVNDSLAVSLRKLKQLTSSVIPTQARRHTTIKFGQNLIAENSVMNQIRLGKADALAERTTIGVTNTFSYFNYESYTDTDGRLKHRILGDSIPTWAGVDTSQAQKFLNDVGLETFLAEYQNEFEHLRNGRVIPEYEDTPGHRTHVITWSQFYEKFGQYRIPSHWQCESGLDIGYTPEHLTAWSWVATSAANSPLPNKKFRYRGLTYEAPLLDDMAIDVKSKLWSGERIVRQRMSHEKKGERLTLNQKHGFHFQSCKSQKTSGIPQWRHYLNSDHTRPHPFHEDTLLEDGTYLMGEPGWFDIVDDDQFDVPRDDRGLKTHREQVVSWLYAPTPLKDTGMREALPVKAFEDTNDSTRMITAEWGPGVTALTVDEKREAKVNPQINLAAIAKEPNPELQQAKLQSHDLQIKRLKAQEEKKKLQARKMATPKVRFRSK